MLVWDRLKFGYQWARNALQPDRSPACRAELSLAECPGCLQCGREPLLAIPRTCSTFTVHECSHGRDVQLLRDAAADCSER